MALVSIKLDDPVFEKYQTFNKSNPRLACQQQLERYQDSSPFDRVLVLNQDHRRRLEKLWSGPIENLDQFVEWIEKLHSIDVLNVKVPLTHNQANQLAAQAKFYQKTPRQHIEEIILRLLRQNIGV